MKHALVQVWVLRSVDWTTGAGSVQAWRTAAAPGRPSYSARRRGSDAGGEMRKESKMDGRRGTRGGLIGRDGGPDHIGQSPNPIGLRPASRRESAVAAFIFSKD